MNSSYNSKSIELSSREHVTWGPVVKLGREVAGEKSLLISMWWELRLFSLLQTVFFYLMPCYFLHIQRRLGGSAGWHGSSAAAARPAVHHWTLWIWEDLCSPCAAIWPISPDLPGALTECNSHPCGCSSAGRWVPKEGQQHSCKNRKLLDWDEPWVLPWKLAASPKGFAQICIKCVVNLGTWFLFCLNLTCFRLENKI